MNTLAERLGPVRRWKDGERLYLENNLCLMAYVVTDDPNKFKGFGMGWHDNGIDIIMIQYITAADAKAWDDV